MTLLHHASVHAYKGSFTRVIFGQTDAFLTVAYTTTATWILPVDLADTAFHPQ